MVYLPLLKNISQLGWWNSQLNVEWKNKTCSKPPTRNGWSEIASDWEGTGWTCLQAFDHQGIQGHQGTRFCQAHDDQLVKVPLFNPKSSWFSAVQLVCHNFDVKLWQTTSTLAEERSTWWRSRRAKRENVEHLWVWNCLTTFFTFEIQPNAFVGKSCQQARGQ